MFPAATPATKRDTASMVPVVLVASSTDAAALASSVASSTGRRPTRSDTAPHTGAPSSCPSEYSPRKKITDAGLTPTCSA